MRYWVLGTARSRLHGDGIPAEQPPRLVVVPEAAHLPNVEQPAQVERALAEHLRRSASRPLQPVHRADRS